MSSDITDEELEWSLPGFSTDDTPERQVSFFSDPSVSISWGRGDVAAGVGVSPMKSWAPEAPPFVVTPIRDYDKSPRGKPPLSQRSLPSPVNPIISPDPVLAKVNIDLSSPSSLSSIFGYSGLLTGQQYVPDLPPTSSPHKAYNRPVDSSTTTESIKSMSPFSNGSLKARRLISEDDSVSTKSHNRSSDYMIFHQRRCRRFVLTLVKVRHQIWNVLNDDRV